MSLAAVVEAGVRVSARQLVGLRHEARGVPLSAVRVRSTQSGLQLSPFKGRGMEFEESRRYQPGDDIRSLDWRVTARTGNPHTKLFREERERPVLLWVDYRPAMFFATEGVFKAVQAAKVAALLAWSAVDHGDRVGGIVFSNDVHHELRPRRGRAAALSIAGELANHPAWDIPGRDAADDGSACEAALGRLRRVARPGSLIFLVSDFRELGQGARAHLTALAAHNDVVLIAIHDRLERELPPADTYRLAGPDTDLVLDTSDPRARAAHAAHFDARMADLENLSRRYGLFLAQCATGDDPVARLREQLVTRRETRRRGAG